MSRVVLSIRNLEVNYYTLRGIVNAVDNLSLDIYEGETIAIVGESGSGKTTLARAILRILPSNASIDKGSILFRINGSKEIDLARATEEELEKIRGDMITMIFQEPSVALSPVHKIIVQITDHLEKKGIDRGKLREQAINLMKRLRMPNPEAVLDMYPHELSGGMKQRVVIASALITRPRIIIADEPTTALDVTVQAQILRLLIELKRDLKSTVIFITHNLAIAAEIADRIAVMYAGQLVEVADKYTLFESPQHPYTKGLLKSIPKPHVDEEIEPIPGEPPSLVNPPKGCRFHPRCPIADFVCMKERPRLERKSSGSLVACHRVD